MSFPMKRVNLPETKTHFPLENVFGDRMFLRDSWNPPSSRFSDSRRYYVIAMSTQSVNRRELEGNLKNRNMPPLRLIVESPSVDGHVKRRNWVILAFGPKKDDCKLGQEAGGLLAERRISSRLWFFPSSGLMSWFLDELLANCSFCWNEVLIDDGLENLHCRSKDTVVSR